MVTAATAKVLLTPANQIRGIMLIDRLFNNKFLLRDIEAEELLESFLVSAIAALLGYRFFLKITGYPTLGGQELHVAHVLFGGAFMLLALIILLSFVSKSAKRLAAVVGGAGFGLFIDEVGKFLTHDNNYFFQPSIAIIYLTFVLIYLLSQRINSGKFSQREYLINSISIAHEAVYNDLDGLEKRRALKLLDECDKKDPLVKAVRALIQELNQVKAKKPSIVSRADSLVRKAYRALVAKKWFSGAVIAFFVAQAVISLWHATEVIKGMRPFIASFVAALFFATKLLNAKSLKKKTACILIITAAAAVIWNSAAAMQNPGLSFISWGELVSSMASGAFVIAGLWLIRKSRMQAYEMFKNAVLVSIFLTQFFAFYKEQFAALLGLGWNIMILITLRYMIKEELKTHKKEAG